MSWPTKKLGEIAEVGAGNSAPQDKKYFADGTIPFFRTADVGRVHFSTELSDAGDFLNRDAVNELGLKIWPKNTILFPKSGASTFLNHRVMIGSNGVVSSHLATIFTEDDILQKYIFYFLTTIDAKMLTADQGYPSLRVSDLQKIKIPLPPLAIQKQIVERLDKIAEAQKLNDDLIKKTDELFQSLFYNEYEVKHNQWDSKKLQEVCKKIDQIHPKKMFKKEFSYIDIASINNDKVIRAQIVSVDKAPSRARKVVKAGDTIFSTVRPYLKHIAYVPEVLDNSIASTGFCVIRPNADLVNTLFLNYIVESDHFVKKVLPFQRGANYPAVSDKNVYDIKIPFPPLKTQKQTVAKLSAVQEYKKQLLEQKKKLKELFDSALHKSFKNE